MRDLSTRSHASGARSTEKRGVKTMKISNDVNLPLDVVTQTLLIVGKRGSGKSNTAARLVEQFHRAHLPFVVLDPVDTWWGLKAGRDGGAGLEGIYVFGGRHQDLPLEASGGALIAEVLCEHRLSMVLSVKHLSGRERSKFMVAFAQTLFQKWGGGPLHIVLEEAHELAPQMASSRGSDPDGDSAMLGAFKRLWKLGRASGIGGTAVTQRPASLSKDITTQSEILIAHRTIGPQDVKAIGEWVKYHGERLDILAELPTLPTGEAFVWAPEFPEGKPIGLQRTSVLLRDTYDSASTPKVGETRVEPKELAAVDLERLRTKMAATIEKAKAEDPKELRKTIGELQRQLKSSAVVEKVSATVVKEKRVEVLTDADRAQLEKVRGRLEAWAGDWQNDADAIVEKVKVSIGALLNVRSEELLRALESKGFQKILAKLATVSPEPRALSPQSLAQSRNLITPGQFVRTRTISQSGTKDTPPVRLESNGNSAVKGGKFREMLIALAQAERPLADYQVTARAGMALSGTFDKYLGQMRTEGWVVGDRSALQITDDGLLALGAYHPLPTGQALQDYWLQKLGNGKKRDMLGALINAYPDRLSDAEVAERAAMALSGTFDKYLGQLRSLMLVEGARQALTASPELFG